MHGHIYIVMPLAWPIGVRLATLSNSSVLNNLLSSPKMDLGSKHEATIVRRAGSVVMLPADLRQSVP